MEFSIKQKDILAEFFCNYAIAWIAGGFIAPFVAGWDSIKLQGVVLLAAFNIAFSFALMLLLVREKK